LNTNQPFRPEDTIVGTDLTILDFWKWGFSNLLTNSLRGIFAEFLVGAAIGAIHQSRIEWDAFDLKYNNKKIEVKSSSYIQAWYSGTFSKISFSIGARKEYDYTLNKYSDTPMRHADIYVFCLLKEKNPDSINPLNTDQWEFYIVSTEKLNEQYPHQKTITLSSLNKLAEPVLYKDLHKFISKLC
jgi:hypothetical protein